MGRSLRQCILLSLLLFTTIATDGQQAYRVRTADALLHMITELRVVDGQGRELYVQRNWLPGRQAYIWFPPSVTTDSLRLDILIRQGSGDTIRPVGVDFSTRVVINKRKISAISDGFYFTDRQKDLLSRAMFGSIVVIGELTIRLDNRSFDLPGIKPVKVNEWALAKRSKPSPPEGKRYYYYFLRDHEMRLYLPSGNDLRTQYETFVPIRHRYMTLHVLIFDDQGHWSMPTLTDYDLVAYIQNNRICVPSYDNRLGPQAMQLAHYSFASFWRFENIGAMLPNGGGRLKKTYSLPDWKTRVTGY